LLIESNDEDHHHDYNFIKFRLAAHVKADFEADMDLLYFSLRCPLTEDILCQLQETQILYRYVDFITRGIRWEIIR